jgi:hypothetical protein
VPAESRAPEAVVLRLGNRARGSRLPRGPAVDRRIAPGCHAHPLAAARAAAVLGAGLQQRRGLEPRTLGAAGLAAVAGVGARARRRHARRTGPPRPRHRAHRPRCRSPSRLRPPRSAAPSGQPRPGRDGPVGDTPGLAAQLVGIGPRDRRRIGHGALGRRPDRGSAAQVRPVCDRLAVAVDRRSSARRLFSAASATTWVASTSSRRLPTKLASAHTPHHRRKQPLETDEYASAWSAHG